MFRDFLFLKRNLEFVNYTVNHAWLQWKFNEYCTCHQQHKCRAMVNQLKKISNTTWFLVIISMIGFMWEPYIFIFYRILLRTYNSHQINTQCNVKELSVFFSYYLFLFIYFYWFIFIFLINLKRKYIWILYFCISIFDDYVFLSKKVILTKIADEE